MSRRAGWASCRPGPATGVRTVAPDRGRCARAVCQRGPSERSPAQARAGPRDAPTLGCCCPGPRLRRSVVGRFARRARPRVRTPLPAGARTGTRPSAAARPRGGTRSEAHLSAQRPQAGQEPRLPPPHVHPSRARHPAQPPPQGPGQAVGLIGRISDRRTFQELRSRGVRVRHGPLSVVHLAPADPDDASTRVAFALTRKVGSAVVRNRLRRRLRALCAELDRTRPGGLPRGALLLSAGPSAVRRTPDELRTDVARLLDALEDRRSRERR